MIYLAWRICSWTAAASIILTALGGAPAHADCAKLASQSSDALAACTQRLQSGVLSGPQLAEGFIQRGLYYAGKNALGVDPMSGDAYRRRGDTKLILKMWAQAAEDFKQAISNGRNTAQVRMHLGLALASYRQYADALPHYDLAISGDPKTYPAYIHRGRAKLKLGNAEAALVDFNQALKLRPSNPAALTGRGNALLALDRLPEAGLAIEKALERRLSYMEALISRGLLYIRRGDVAPGVLSLSMATTSVWQVDYGRLATARIYGWAGEKDATKKNVREVLTVNGADPRYQTHAADILCDIGDVEGALRAWAEARRIDAQFLDRQEALVASFGFPAASGGGEAGLRQSLRAYTSRACPAS